MRTRKELENTTNLLIVTIGNDGGVGELFQLGKKWASVIWSFGCGWEHVSACPYKRSYTPTWEEMCRLKDMFFRDDEVVVQYHPAKSEYVNNMPNCLHLWRPIEQPLPTPPAIMVGIKAGQTDEEIRRAIKEVCE